MVWNRKGSGQVSRKVIKEAYIKGVTIMALDNYEDYNQFITASVIAQATKSAIDIELFIMQGRLAGMTDDVIEALLIADLAEGGFILGAYANGVTSSVKGGVNLLGKAGSMNEYINAGVEQYQWITTNGKNVCPDCQPREGRVEDKETWESIGEPATGWSVCKLHCKCTLEAMQYDGKKSFDKKQK